MKFDKDKAIEMIGKYAIVGITRLDGNNQILSKEEVHGEIIRASEEYGVTILQKNGAEYNLPPFLDCYQKADEGVYTLKSTAEKITNPDYVATFEVSST